MRAVSNRGSERREDAGTRSGAVAARGVDPGEESPHTTRGESRRVRGSAKASAQGGARRRGGEGRSRGRGSAPGRQHRRGAGMLQCGGGRGIFLAGEGGLR